MTREEALNKAINIVSYFEAHFAKSKEAREDAVNIIEALEQETCGDVISRQAAVDAINALHEKSNAWLDSAVDAVMALPPVLPQQKIGYWLMWYERKETEQYRENIPHCNCSECGKEYDPHSSQFIKFCSNCGAKMVEP